MLEYLKKEAQKLIGQKLVGTAIDKENNAFALIFEKYVVWVLSDEEGNNCGFLDIQERKQ